jgi:hypothetical protein
MAGFGDFLVQYKLETEWLVTWFPTKEGAPFDSPRIAGGFFGHKIADFDSPGIGGGVQEQHSLPIPSAKLTNVAAFITIGIDQNYIFQAELEVSLGTNRRRKYFQLQPGTVTPFMVNVAAGGTSREVTNTGIVLQGVFTAGERAGLARIALSSLLGK